FPVAATAGCEIGLGNCGHWGDSAGSVSVWIMNIEVPRRVQSCFERGPQEPLRFGGKDLASGVLVPPGWAGCRLFHARGESNNPQKTREKQGVSGSGGTDSGTPLDAGGLEALAAALRGLSPADRARLAALLISEQAEGKDA